MEFSSRGGVMADKILLVDDDPALLKLAEKILRQEGYEVALARDGLEALSIFVVLQTIILLL